MDIHPVLSPPGEEKGIVQHLLQDHPDRLQHGTGRDRSDHVVDHDAEAAWHVVVEPANRPRLPDVEQPEQAERVRGPDFAVSYTTSMTFMVEVTRVRVDKTEQKGETPSLPSVPFLAMRVADTVCSKLGQLLPQRSNVLLIGVESNHLANDDLRVAMLNIQQRAERNDSAFLQRYRFRDRADFFRQYQRLSEILVRGTSLRESEPPLNWVNPQAKHPLPGKVRSSLYRSHTILANQVYKTTN